MSEDDETFSFWGTRALYCGWTALLGMVASSLPFWLLPDPVDRAVGIVMIAGFLVGAIRGARVLATNTTDHLIVRNPWWTHRVAWRDIDEIIDAQPWQLKGVPCPAIHRRGRRDLPIIAMAAWDRLVSSETSLAGLRAAFLIRRWGRSRGVEVSALSSMRRDHSPRELDL